MFVTVARFFRQVSGATTVTIACARSSLSQIVPLVPDVVSTAVHVPLEHGVVASHAVPVRVPPHVHIVTSWPTVSPGTVKVPWPIAVFVVSVVMLLFVHVNANVSLLSRTPLLFASPTLWVPSLLRTGFTGEHLSSVTLGSVNTTLPSFVSAYL